MVSVFTKYLCSTNRKCNRIGLLLLKFLLLTDIQEMVKDKKDHHSFKSFEEYHLGMAIATLKLTQNDHSTVIGNDDHHLLLDRYLLDIQQVCLHFYHHEDIIVQVEYTI